MSARRGHGFGHGTLVVEVPGPAGRLPGWSVKVDGRPVKLDEPVRIGEGTDASPSSRVELRFRVRRPGRQVDARLETRVAAPRGQAVRLRVPVDALLHGIRDLRTDPVRPVWPADVC